jgi:hypothetical protein
MHSTTIGIDLAKSVFQVSVANQAGKVVDRKRLTRRQFERFLNQQDPEGVKLVDASLHFFMLLFSPPQAAVLVSLD